MYKRKCFYHSLTKVHHISGNTEQDELGTFSIASGRKVLCIFVSVFLLWKQLK